MQSSRIRLLVRAFLILIFSVFTGAMSGELASASIISAEYEMRIPRPFQQNLIEESWKTLQREQFHLNWQIGDQNYDTPEVKVQLSGVTLDLKTNLEKPRLGNAGPALILRSRNLQVELNIASIQVDQYIERDVGGVIGRFRVQARCDNVRLHLKSGQGAFQITLNPEFSGSLIKSHLQDVDLTWAQDSWTHEPLQCSGAQGFEDVVEKEIVKLSGDAAQITADKTSLIHFLQKILDEKALDLAQPRQISTGRPDIRAALTVDEFLAVPDGALARGKFTVDFMKSTSIKNELFKLSASPAPCGTCTQAQLRIPEAFVTALTAEVFAANSWSKSFSSTEIPGFSHLLKSRISQALVWPALLKFLPDDIFIFKLSSERDLEISGKDLNYQFRTRLTAAMQAPEGNQHVPFMNFVVPLTGVVQLSVTGGRAQAKFQSVDLSLQAHWEPSYLKDHIVGQKFAADKISSKMKDALTGQSLFFVLPKIPLADSLALKIKDLKAIKNSTDVLMTLKP